jgi:hypothetical protein
VVIHDLRSARRHLHRFRRFKFFIRIFLIFWILKWRYISTDRSVSPSTLLQHFLTITFLADSVFHTGSTSVDGIPISKPILYGGIGIFILFMLLLLIVLYRARHEARKPKRREEEEGEEKERFRDDDEEEDGEDAHEGGRRERRERREDEKAEDEDDEDDEERHHHRHRRRED